MAEQFYTILTNVGKAKIANAVALGEKVELTEMALGDGGGSYYNPTEDQTELRNEVWRGVIGNVTVDEENPTWITIQTMVTSQHGGFMIREAGVFDDEGDLIAVGKYPETYKPVLANGSIKDLVVRMILEVDNTSSVVLKVDPTVVLATQRQVNEAEARAKAYTDQEVAEAEARAKAYTDQEVAEVDQALACHTTHAGEQLSLQQNGYCKMANGLIIQWGKVPFDRYIFGQWGNVQVVTFPIAFPNTCLSITGAKNSQSSDWGPENFLAFNYITKTGFRLNTLEPPSDYFNVYWLAIGC